MNKLIRNVVKDISGQRFGRLTAVEFVERRNGMTMWRCKCDCGGEKMVSYSNLKSGSVSSCGCIRRRDLTGQRFGRLTAIKCVGLHPNRKAKTYDWLCKCDCGNEIVVLVGDLTSGNTRSCGCLKNDLLLQRRAASGIDFHGQSHTRIYKIWRGMKDRCYNNRNNKYHCYGGRGISVCDEWLHDFPAFMNWAYANGYDENARRGQCTIERIDNNGNYEPANCRWATQKEQLANTSRKTDVVYQGQHMTIPQLSELTGVKYHTLYDRLSKGVPVGLAVQKTYPKIGSPAYKAYLEKEDNNANSATGQV